MIRWRQGMGLLLAWCLSACSVQPAAPPMPPVKLAVTQVPRGVLIWLPDDVLFEFGAATLSPQADDHLRQVAQLARERTKESLALEGHTDSVGSADFNQALSLRRATAVADALQRLGVPAARMKAVGHGLSQPLAPNDSEVGRRLNRRVEIIVLNETVAHLSEGQEGNRFEDAFEKLKAELGDRLQTKGFH